MAWGGEGCGWVPPARATRATTSPGPSTPTRGRPVRRATGCPRRKETTRLHGGDPPAEPTAQLGHQRIDDPLQTEGALGRLGCQPPLALLPGVDRALDAHAARLTSAAPEGSVARQARDDVGLLARPDHAQLARLRFDRR